MTTAAMATYAYDQIDQARTELNAGSLVTISERLCEKLQRHGPDWPGAGANPERDDYIRAAARRVVQRLASMGRTDAYLNV
jgi:hypothetical protein